jgi:hypothetical protein
VPVGGGLVLQARNLYGVKHVSVSQPTVT